MELLGSSEYSSGCESGWTLYLDHSASSTNPSNYRDIHGFTEKIAKEKRVYEDDDDDEEEVEDLSMVSDASSGPPHFNEDEACDYGYKPHSVSSSAATALNNVCGKKQRKRENRGREDRKMASFVDDTASSPFINLSNSNFGVNDINQASLGSALDYSQGFSATHFQGGPAFQEDFGLFHSPLSGNQLQNNQWF